MFVNRQLAPDLVVNTGDLVALSPEVAELFEAPVLMLPGNHDVGEVGDRPWMGIEVTTARVDAYRQSFGEDRWLRALDNQWALLGRG